MGKCVALGTLSFVLESKNCWCQQRNAMNGMGSHVKHIRQERWGSFGDYIIAYGKETMY